MSSFGTAELILADVGQAPFRELTLTHTNSPESDRARWWSGLEWVFGVAFRCFGVHWRAPLNAWRDRATRSSLLW
jgi:hypothetical protein